MALKKRSKKSVAWYRTELRTLERMVDQALDAKDEEQRGIILAAMAAVVSAAAEGREMYLER